MNPGAMSVDANVAQYFVPMYYQLIDTQREQLHRLYHENAQVTRDGKIVQGLPNIQQLFQSVPATQHKFHNFNGYPGPFGATSTIIEVTGEYESSGVASHFKQVFVLLQLPTGSYGIHDDQFSTINAYGQPFGGHQQHQQQQQFHQQQQLHQQHQQQQHAGGFAQSTIAPQDADRRSIFVGHVEYQATEDSLKALFASFGAIKRLTIKRVHETGQSKGFAYIEFEDEISAQNALQANGTQFMGLELKVTPKRTNVPGFSKGANQFSGNVGHQANGNYRGGRGGGRGGRGGYQGNQNQMAF